MDKFHNPHPVKENYSDVHLLPQDRYDIDQFADKASNGILEDAWANFNNGVYRCNLVLDRIDEANFDATLKKQYKGEALFIRALYLQTDRYHNGLVFRQWAHSMSNYHSDIRNTL